MLKKFTKNEKGQAMVEFALITPLLILLVCGIIDFGWIFGNQLIMNNACRDTARFMAINYMDATKTGATLQLKIDKAEETFTNRLGGYTYLINDDLEVTLPGALVPPTGDSVTVAATYPLPLLTPVLSGFFPDSIYTIKIETTMRLE